MPVILVSGMGGLGDAIKALKLGAWDYLTKPIEDMAVLEYAIDKSLERARLLRENREYREHLEEVNDQLKQSLRKLEEDESAGRRMQFQLLPEDGKVRGGLEFSRRLLPSLYLSGDFVDYFVIDDDHLGFYMADVSGHGVSSAFVTVLLKSNMYRYLNLYRQDWDSVILEPARILKRINRDMFQGQIEKYLTMFYGVIGLSDNCLRYSNGGQFPFPILFDGQETRFFGGKSMPVGLFDFAEYRTDTLDLPERFAMTLFSDGILDVLPQAKLKDKQAYLLSLVNRKDLSVETLIDTLGLEAPGSLPDDVTIMLIKRGL